MDLLSNRVILVTGGANGIGLACAKAYAEEGARVAIVDQDAAAAQSVAENLSTPGLAVPCDVGDPDQVRAAVEFTISHFGSLHAVHNNAGIATPSAPLHCTSDAEWDRLFSVNLKSVLYTTRNAIESLRSNRGCILNTASLVGDIGQSKHAAYVASKGAMIALTKAMALDYSPWGIRVNAICPAGVWTDTLRQWAAEQPHPDSIAEYLDSIHPLGPCPEAKVVADAAVFLMSDRAAFITGCILPVSGGAELGYRREVQ